MLFLAYDQDLMSLFNPDQQSLDWITDSVTNMFFFSIQKVCLVNPKRTQWITLYNYWGGYWVWCPLDSHLLWLSHDPRRWVTACDSVDTCAMALGSLFGYCFALWGSAITVVITQLKQRNYMPSLVYKYPVNLKEMPQPVRLIHTRM